MKKILILLLLLSLYSCDIIHLLMVKERKNESKLEVEEFLNRKHYKFDQSVLLNDSLHWLRKTDDYVFSKTSKLASAIELRIFDSIGVYHTSFSTCHGDFTKKGYLTSLPIAKNNQHDYINQTLSLKKELVLFDMDECDKEIIEQKSKNYQYTIVVYYTIWTNHFSERVLKEVSKFKKHNPNKVYVVLCNVATDLE